MKVNAPYSNGKIMRLAEKKGLLVSKRYGGGHSSMGWRWTKYDGHFRYDFYTPHGYDYRREMDECLKFASILREEKVPFWYHVGPWNEDEGKRKWYPEIQILIALTGIASTGGSPSYTQDDTTFMLKCEPWIAHQQRQHNLEAARKSQKNAIQDDKRAMKRRIAVQLNPQLTDADFKVVMIAGDRETVGMGWTTLLLQDGNNEHCVVIWKRKDSIYDGRRTFDVVIQHAYVDTERQTVDRGETSSFEADTMREALIEYLAIFRINLTDEDEAFIESKYEPIPDE